MVDERSVQVECASVDGWVRVRHGNTDRRRPARRRVLDQGEVVLLVEERRRQEPAPRAPRLP